jgi:hypothetical protein
LADVEVVVALVDVGADEDEDASARAALGGERRSVGGRGEGSATIIARRRSAVVALVVVEQLRVEIIVAGVFVCVCVRERGAMLWRATRRRRRRALGDRLPPPCARASRAGNSTRSSGISPGFLRDISGISPGKQGLGASLTSQRPTHTQ